MRIGLATVAQAIVIALFAAAPLRGRRQFRK